MKLLLENWRKYLAEGMKTVSDLPSDAAVVIVSDPDETGPGSKMIYYTWLNPETGKTNPPTTADARAHPNLFGEITIVPLGNGCQDAWEAHSSADSGWGPLLYDIAMEYTTINGGGLMSARGGTSPPGQRVWNQYLKSRPDVTPHQLDDKKNTLTPPDEDNCDQLKKYTDPGRIYTLPDEEPEGGWEDADPQDPATLKRKDWLTDGPGAAFSKRYTKEPTTINALGDRLMDLTQ